MCRTARSGSGQFFKEPITGITSLRTSASRLQLISVNSQPNLTSYNSGQYYYDKHRSFNKDITKVFNKFNRINYTPQQSSFQNLTQDQYVTRILPISPSETLLIDQPKTSRTSSNRFIHHKANSLITFTQKQKLKNAGSLQTSKLSERMVLILLNHNLTKYCYFNIPIPKQRSSQREAELLLHQVGKELLDQLKLGQIELYFYSKKGEPIKSLFDCFGHKTIIVSPTKQFNGIPDTSSVLGHLEKLESVLYNTTNEIKSESLETFISKKYQQNIQSLADYLQQQDDKTCQFRMNSAQVESLYRKCKQKAIAKIDFKQVFNKKFNNLSEIETPYTEKYQTQDEYLQDEGLITISTKQVEHENIIRQYSRDLQILQKTIIQNHDPDSVAPSNLQIYTVVVLLNGKLVKYEDTRYNDQHVVKLQELMGEKIQPKSTYEVQFTSPKHVGKNVFQKHYTKKQLLQTLQKRQKLLFTQNIPQLISETKLNRKELYQTFILYQALEAVSSQMEDDYTIGEGVSFEAFRNGIYQVSMQPTDFAKQMFQQIDYNFSGYLNWREFLNLMVAIRAKTLMDRVNLFIKIADKDGNKALSYDEVHNLTKMCLTKYIKEDCQLLDKLCDYFTKLIFETLEVAVENDIPLEKIKQTILDGGANSELLCMFCGADL